MAEKYYYIFQTQAGWMGLSGSPSGICRTTLPQLSRQDTLRTLGLTEAFQESVEFFTSLIQTFESYYQGFAVEFTVQLDFSGLSDFQISVYQAALTIPYGKTQSYGWIARKINNPLAARAVGQALGHNPFPVIVPCHRVLASGGGLGGFSGGLTLKQYLLKLETTNSK